VAVDLTHLLVRNYSPEFEPGILRLLQASFGQAWGTRDYWRWKHTARPEFVPADVLVFTHEEKTIACFHLTVRRLRLGPGLEVSCSVEGDFAIDPGSRGGALAQNAYVQSAPRLVERSVVLRSGFSTPELYNRLYKPKFGHRMMPTVTAQYRKILSDGALRAKLEDLGHKLRLHARGQRLLKRGPLTIRFDISGFAPCQVAVKQDSSSCTGDVSAPADLRVRIPYALLAAARMRPLPAALAAIRAILSGQVRVRGLARFLARWLRS
jgi:hypothetical protein